MKKALKILLPVLFVVGAFNIVRADEGAFKERTIKVVGEGKVTAIPDQAEMEFTVQEEGADLKTVSGEVSAKMKNVFKVVKSFGISDKDTQTISYNIEPRYKYDKSGNGQKTGYIVSNRVKIILKDLDKAGDVLEAVTEAEVTQVEGPNFNFSDPTKLQIEALKAAVEDGHSKAEALAMASGAELDKVFSISQTSTAMPISPVAFRANALQEGAQSVPIAKGQNEVTAQVEIVYLLK